MAKLHCLLFLGIALSASANPTPGRIPKVYNALITSNQNLEPSKAYPVYQPVLHDTAFTFPLQTPYFFGGEIPLGNGFIPSVAILPKQSNVTPKPPPEASSEAPAAEVPVSTEESASTPASATAQPENSSEAPKTPDSPPSTESPIPLNEFGLPPQVIPITRTYNTFPNFGHFPYTYPSLRFYDPFDPFGFHPFAGLPALYQPLTNVIGQYEAAPSNKAEATPAPDVSNQSSTTPPPEPSDLNVLNYSPKDPEIANVPPPPLPQGGLKSDASE
ncbi:uncharacterized protein [Battus philenor]|uniref:uncharacterized protein n=1 Tax=Battus philenor TaxID=42288 RepID=UPI0035D01EC8